MTIAGRLTLYRIKRDHSDRTEFFWIDVPEVKQCGVGFQLNLRGVLYGVSIHTRAKPAQ